MDKIIEYLSVDPAVIGGVAIVVELILRLVKSDKPLSIAHVIAAGARKIGQLCTKVADLLDKVLPQKTK